MKKPNLLVLGASGGVANAFLHSLVHHRDLFGRLVLLDKNKKVLSNEYLDHKSLKYVFLHQKIVLPEKEKEYHAVLKKYKIGIVLDITDMASIPVIESTDKLGISCVNTGMNDDKRDIADLVFEAYHRKNELNKAPHILCSGMNPGVVNMWVRYGIEKFGIPDEIIHFEYDTSKIVKGWKSMMTWSIHEFIAEALVDPAGFVIGRDNAKKMPSSSIDYREDMKPILKPILSLDKYPEGFILVHEENASVGSKYDIPSKFIYAVNMQTMENLMRLYRAKHNITIKDFILGDNTHIILDGSDSIGVILEYGDKKVYYFNTISNISVMGTNATYTQVIVGVFSALFTLMFDRLPKGIHFPEDLYHSHYRYYLFDNMRVQEFVFKKEKSGKLSRVSYNPEIKIKRNDHFDHMFI
ncbi:MAG: saccharopine dehydrogenase NADP-binding domain-containing protein [Candidatus Micrarchaeota archaeon]